MNAIIFFPFLFAVTLAGDAIIAHSVEPLPQYNQKQNTATGEYEYSYHGGPSAKTEFRASDGTTTGTYSYVDANGILQTVSYIADEFGFRAAGSNIPSASDIPVDASDVLAAKTLHLAEHSPAAFPATLPAKPAYLPSSETTYPAGFPFAGSVTADREAIAVEST